MFPGDVLIGPILRAIFGQPKPRREPIKLPDEPPKTLFQHYTLAEANRAGQNAYVESIRALEEALAARALLKEADQ